MSLWRSSGEWCAALRLAAFMSTSGTGRPALEAIDATMSNALHGHDPFPEWRSYSLEWKGFLAVRRSAGYTFWVSSDDGSTIEVDGATVADSGEHLQRRAMGR